MMICKRWCYSRNRRIYQICFAGPVEDKNPKYDGWIFKFNPMFEDTQLYIKIRIENIEKSVCLSVHEFGKYDEVN